MQNARPAPVITTTRTDGAAAMRATASLRSATQRRLPALSTRGRSSTSRASGPSISSRIASTASIIAGRMLRCSAMAAESIFFRDLAYVFVAAVLGGRSRGWPGSR